MVTNPRIQRLYRPEDIVPLAIFRMAFGLLCFLEAVGAIMTGWVTRAFVDTQFTFSFIGFEWLQPLPGIGMYVYYLVMGVAGLGILFGYRYRLSTALFALLWAGCYLMQKSSYNNHYYFLMLLNFLMLFLPAHQAYSLDARRNSNLRSDTMPAWVRMLFIAQMGIVYTYAALHKVNPDWLALKPISMWFAAKSDYWLIGPLLEQKTMQYLVAYGGVGFDLLVVPLLLWRKTRPWAFGISLLFHLFNSAVFQIGIFPYLMIALSIFFFPPALIRKKFLPRSKAISIVNDYKPLTTAQKGWAIILATYILVQVSLPLRHHLIEGDVNWTEEGHRLSWRMMLRSKWGRIYVRVNDAGKENTEIVDLQQYLTDKQIRAMSTRPDMIWQFAQRLEAEYKEKGFVEPEVHVFAQASLNGRRLQQLIDPKVNLAAESWKFFGHHHWILPLQPREQPTE